MRVAVYDRNPGGGGAWQSFLKLTWMIGCFIHKLFGKLDDYYGASSWDDAFKWLHSLPTPIKSIQFWAHGSPGAAYIAQINVDREQFKRISARVSRDTVIWFRMCSVFSGQRGYDLSEYLADTLQCTIAGHTKTVGILQPGLYTRKMGQKPSWSIDEKDAGNSALVFLGLQWDKRTVLCLKATVPEGW